MKMFNIEDYLVINTSAREEVNQNPTIVADVGIDKKKIKEDAELFAVMLRQLEKTIGPYTIKVNSKKTKIKAKGLNK